MLEGIPKISVMVITYKQEKLIGRALESLLAQKDYLYEICVSDDCSPDNTWRVLLEYQNKFPEIIKLHRNEHNVGIFENIEQRWTMPTGDVVCGMAGDDEAGEGWFKKVVEFIIEKGIDWKNELFCIYCDGKNLYPNGDYYISHDKAIAKYPDKALRLALRGIISNRGCCYSINVLRKFEKVSQGRSHIAEMAMDRQLQMYAERNYYIPAVGNIYYANIGVSAHLNEDTLNDRKKIRPYAEQYIESKGEKISKSDKYYGKYMTTVIDFRFHPSFLRLMKAIWYYIKSFSIPYSFLGDDMRRYVFALLRRIPHKRPIEFK